LSFIEFRRKPAKFVKGTVKNSELAVNLLTPVAASLDVGYLMLILLGCLMLIL